MTEQKATNVHWHEGEIQREHRHQLLGQQGATLWFTGLSGSGKSTVAVALEDALHKRGRLSYRLDGDNVRLGINKNLGFSADEEDGCGDLHRRNDRGRRGEGARLHHRACASGEWIHADGIESRDSPRIARVKCG